VGVWGRNPENVLAGLCLSCWRMRFTGLLRVVALDIETQTPPVSGVEHRSVSVLKTIIFFIQLSISVKIFEMSGSWIPPPPSIPFLAPMVPS
jgi:organic hydroperoxide reductase OsmC/OhrA